MLKDSSLTKNTNLLKSKLRKEALIKRKEAFNQIKQIRAIARLKELIDKQPDHNPLAGYLAIGTEIAPISLMTRLHNEDNTNICVPVIADKDLPLRFREWAPQSKLTTGRFNVKIPITGQFFQPKFIIVPLLAFDQNGYRLGYGGGFYDRTLASLRLHHSILAVGLAFAAQEFNSLPVDNFDQILDAVVTENDLHIFNNKVMVQ